MRLFIISCLLFASALAQTERRELFIGPQLGNAPTDEPSVSPEEEFGTAFLDPMIWTVQGTLKELKYDGDYVAMYRDDIVLRAKVWNYYFREVEIVHLETDKSLLLMDSMGNVYMDHNETSRIYVDDVDCNWDYDLDYSFVPYRRCDFFMRFNTDGVGTAMKLSIATNTHTYNDAAVHDGKLGLNLDMFVDRPHVWDDIELWQGFWIDGKEITNSNEELRSGIVTCDQ